MPSSILSIVNGKPSFSATNENTSTAVWQQLGIVEIGIQSSSANTDSPISNQQIADSGTYQDILNADIQTVKILQPSRLRIVSLCSDLSTLENIISTFKDVTTTISINTKSVITSSLALTTLDVTQDGDSLTASRLVLVFEQAQPPAKSGYAPQQDADATVYGVSIQTPPSVTPLATLTKAISSAAFVPTISVSGALIDSKGGPFILDSSKLS